MPLPPVPEGFKVVEEQSDLPPVPEGFNVVEERKGFDWPGALQTAFKATPVGQFFTGAEVAERVTRPYARGPIQQGLMRAAGQVPGEETPYVEAPWQEFKRGFGEKFGAPYEEQPQAKETLEAIGYPSNLGAQIALETVTSPSTFVPFKTAVTATKALRAVPTTLRRRAGAVLATNFSRTFARGTLKKLPRKDVIRIVDDIDDLTTKYNAPPLPIKFNKKATEESLTQLRTKIGGPLGNLERQYDDFYNAVGRGLPPPDPAFTPKSVQLGEEFVDEWTKISRKLSQQDELLRKEDRLYDILRSKVEDHIKTGHMGADEALRLKRAFSSTLFDPVTGKKKKVATEISKSLRDMRNLLDDVFSSAHPELGDNARDYSKLLAAVPDEYLSSLDFPTYHPTVTSMLGGAGAGGFISGTMAVGAGAAGAPLVAAPVIGLVAGWQTVKAARAMSKPGFHVAMLNFAQKNNKPLLSVYYQIAAEEGINAANQWLPTLGSQAPILTAEIATAAQTALQNDPEVQRYFRNEISTDKDLSSIEKANIISEINAGRASFAEENNQPDNNERGASPKKSADKYKFNQ